MVEARQLAARLRSDADDLEAWATEAEGFMLDRGAP